MKGRLISFEGGEGSGKSTQAKRLFEYLQQNNIPSILTREPGGTETAEKIRNILVTGKLENIDSTSEVLLHYTARNEHIKKKIVPALADGKIVVTDRFFDSTIAYQGYGHGVSLDIIDKIHKLVVGDMQPDVTFLFDIEAQKGLDRSEKRHAQEDCNENRYESIGIDFHTRLRNGFLAIAKKNSERFIVLDAEENIEILSAKVLEGLKRKHII